LRQGRDSEELGRVFRIWKTLLKLPDLQILTLVFGSHWYYTSVDQELVVEVATHACQGLQKLSFTSVISLDFLGRLHQLRELFFTGCSKSSPEKTLAILRKLPCLKTVVLCGYSELRGKAHRRRLSTYLSFTPKVLCGLKPLTRFGIHLSASRPRLSAVINPEMMDALLIHRATLRDLSIGTDSQCDVATFEKILEVISSASLKFLCLRMGLPPEYKVSDIQSRIPKSIFHSTIDLWETRIDGGRALREL
jgi:hypothetical protein